MIYPTTKERLEKEIQTRLTESQAELEAMKLVKINTDYKVLTNRAIENGRIGDYITDKKALYVSYAIVYSDGHTRYASYELPCYVFTGETEGILKASRTMTPLELRELLYAQIANRTEGVKKFKKELKNAAKIVNRYNALAEKINKHNDALSYAAASARI